MGSIRAADRVIYSALGNTTNLASRLQGLTRELDASVVIEPHPDMHIRGLSEQHDIFAKPQRG